MASLATLQAQLAALKSESQELDADISAAADPGDGRMSYIYLPQLNANTAGDTGEGSRHYGSSSRTPTPPAEHRGRQRGAVIRRVGMAGAAFMGVAFVCTLASQQTAGVSNSLLGVAGLTSLAAVPRALKAVGSELTVGERKLFANDATRLADDEVRHQRLEQDRAEHLLKLITSTVDHNEKHDAMKKQIAAKIQAHREALALLKHERSTMIRGTNGKYAVGHPQTAHGVPLAAQKAARKKGLDGEIDEAFHQQLVDEHARDSESHEQREGRFMQEREAAQLAHQSKERAVDDARERYHDVREYVVKAKDALKDALAERDQTTEKVRREGFISPKEASAQLAPIQEKVQRLIQEVVVAKSQWEAAHAVLENAESIGTRPELSFPAPFTHHPVQQLALSRKSPKIANAPALQSAGLLPASAAAAAASAVAEQVSTLANANAQQQHAMTLSATTSKQPSTQPHLLGGAQDMVAAARHRLAVKAGLTGGLTPKDLKTIKGPRTYGGEDNLVPVPAGIPSMFSAPEEVLAAKTR